MKYLALKSYFSKVLPSLATAKQDNPKRPDFLHLLKFFLFVAVVVAAADVVVVDDVAVDDDDVVVVVVVVVAEKKVFQFQFFFDREQLELLLTETCSAAGFFFSFELFRNFFPVPIVAFIGIFLPDRKPVGEIDPALSLHFLHLAGWS